MKNRNRWTLVGLTGAARGKEFVLLGEGARIGRTPDNDITLSERGVSRYHAMFAFENGELWIQDLDSKNGTFVNRKRILKAKISDRDVVYFGECSLRLKSDFAETYTGAVHKETHDKNNTAFEDIKFKLSGFVRTPPGKFTVFAISFVIPLLITSLFPNPPKAKVETKTSAVEEQSIEPAIIKPSPVTQETFEPLPVQTPSAQEENFVAMQTPTAEETTVTMTTQTPSPTTQASSIPDPEQLNIWKEKASTAFQMGDFAAAHRWYKKILSGEPSDEKAVAKLQDTESKLKELITSYEENGMREFEKLNYDKAISEWTKVLSLSEEFDPATYQRTLTRIQDAKEKLGGKQE